MAVNFYIIEVEQRKFNIRVEIKSLHAYYSAYVTALVTS